MTKALMEAALWSLPANAENSAEKTRTVASANTASGTTPHRDSNRNAPTGYPPADTQVERPDDPLGQIGVGSTYLSDYGFTSPSHLRRSGSSISMTNATHSVPKTPQGLGLAARDRGTR